MAQIPFRVAQIDHDDVFVHASPRSCATCILVGDVLFQSVHAEH
jgi:hypothetical protein